MSRGVAFISDAAISSLCILLMLMATMHIIAENWRREALSGHESEKELFALAVSESIVKNRSETDPAKGAAYFDFAKKRVEVNVLDETLLNKIEPRETGKYYFAGVYEKSRGMGTVQTNGHTGCISVERFTVVKGVFERKGIIGVVVCE